MMSVGAIIAVVTLFWASVGILGPLTVHFGNKKRLFKTDPNTGIIIVMLILTAVCCWLFWILAFLSQYKPLIGPELKLETACIIQLEWFGIPPVDGCPKSYSSLGS